MVAVFFMTRKNNFIIEPAAWVQSNSWGGRGSVNAAATKGGIARVRLRCMPGCHAVLDADGRHFCGHGGPRSRGGPLTDTPRYVERGGGAWASKERLPWMVAQGWAESRFYGETSRRNEGLSFFEHPLARPSALSLGS